MLSKNYFLEWKTRLNHFKEKYKNQKSDLFDKMNFKYACLISLIYISSVNFVSGKLDLNDLINKAGESGQTKESTPGMTWKSCGKIQLDSIFLFYIINFVVE